MEMALYRRKPNQNPITSIFKYTVNSAAKTLVSVAHPGITGGLWKAEPLRFMANLLVRSTVWVLQILMDHLPYFMKPSSPYKLLQGSLPLGFLTYDSSSSSSTLSSALGCIPSMDIALPALPDSDEPSVTSLERALSQILTLINKIPATSSKYQSAMSMATKIMEENGKTGNVELLEINRTALASAFARTSQLLHSSLERTRAEEEGEGDSIVSTLAEQLMHLVPMGSYVTTCVKTVRTCANAVASAIDQEVILTNWFEDFSVSASEWPNLQISYDRWCQDSRQLVE